MIMQLSLYLKSLKRRKDPDMWFEDLVKPGKESELRQVRYLQQAAS